MGYSHNSGPKIGLLVQTSIPNDTVTNGDEMVFSAPCDGEILHVSGSTKTGTCDIALSGFGYGYGYAGTGSVDYMEAISIGTTPARSLDFLTPIFGRDDMIKVDFSNNSSAEGVNVSITWKSTGDTVNED